MAGALKNAAGGAARSGAAVTTVAIPAGMRSARDREMGRRCVSSGTDRCPGPARGTLPR